MGSLRKLYAILQPRDRRNAVLLLLLMLVGAALEVVGVAAVPAYVSVIVDPQRMSKVPLLGSRLARLQGVETGTLMIWGGVALIALFAIKNAFLVWNYVKQVQFVTNRRVELSARMMRAYMRAPYVFHLNRNTSELLRNVDQEVSTICTAVIATLLDLGTRIFILVAVLGFLAAVEPWITLAWVIILGSCAAGGIAFMSGRLRVYGQAEQVQRRRFVQALFQALGSIKETRILHRDGFFTGKVVDTVSQIAVFNRYRSIVGKSITPMGEFVAITGLLTLASVLVLIGRPTDSILVTLSLFVVGLVRLREVMTAAITHFAHLRYSMVSIDPVYADLTLLEGAQPAPAADGAPARPQPLRRCIELRDVVFGYEGARDAAIKGVSLSIPAGAAVGLVGSTGAGKSTIVDILLGLLEPQEGSVLIDGVELAQRGLGGWQTTIGYVPQAIYLLDDTIRRNIALGVGDDEIDERALTNAVRIAQLEPFLDRQPDGLETMVGERGVRLSGGERQRIGIARALYHDPTVIVFDEATSALDNTTERLIIEAVERLRGERTVIMIAHRLSTVRGCDRLYFLKDGRIEAEGDYDELRHGHHEFRLMASA